MFVSLCSSDAAGSPRGIGFLLDRNRLNVAVSRAETLCVVVGYPRLAMTRPRSLADVRRVNFVSALVAGSAGAQAFEIRNPAAGAAEFPAAA